jgi:hypothetical protein
MALQTFSVGAFRAWPEVAEWDGKNHDEIATWLNRLDGNTDPSHGWRVTAITDKAVTLFKPAEKDDPTWPDDREVVVRRGEWVCTEQSAAAGSKLKIVRVLDATGKWKTADPYGRPGNLGDIASTLPKGKD